MKLHEHPSLKNWPPAWLPMPGETRPNLEDQKGVLRNTNLSRIDPVTICYLTVEFEGEFYIGRLTFAASALCRKVCDLMQANVGKSVQEIGELDVPEALQRCLPVSYAANVTDSNTALEVLTDALKRCRSKICARMAALDFRESKSAIKSPFGQFRGALEGFDGDQISLPDLIQRDCENW